MHHHSLGYKRTTLFGIATYVTRAQRDPLACETFYIAEVATDGLGLPSSPWQM